MTASLLAAATPAAPDGAGQAGRDPSRPETVCEPSHLDSPYIPVDSWVYPAMMRLYSLGFVDTMYLGMRPWTRSSVERMIEEAGAHIEDADDSAAKDEAEGIYESVNRELNPEMVGPCGILQGKTRIESVYTVVRGISGTPLDDSFHLGQTVVNDYGRPLQNGFNNYSGASGYVGAGRFLIYARGEFQGSPSGTGYSAGLASALSAVDVIPFLNPVTGLPYHQATIPLGPLSSVTRVRWVEAYASAHVLNHEISFGKQDEWLGPGLGAGMAYSNNAENFYTFRINRIEPLHVPGLSYITGPFRYEFLIGGLHGHTYVPNPLYPTNGQANVYNPGDPWMHLEKVSFRPTQNVEIGFERSVIWGGQGHGPITIHSFLKSFFSLSSPSITVKQGRDDPGARFGAFDASYRLPWMRKWLTFYVDSEAHDEISPPDAPRRSSYRPGLYLSHVPGVPKLDVRAEYANTDPSTNDSQGGHFEYWETIQRQGYTNNGQLMGDWVGREGKGGQGWLTYHLSGNEWIQVGVRNQKVSKDFIPGGTTLNDINFQVLKRIGRDFQIDGRFAYEQWKAPIFPAGIPLYPASQQNVTTTTIQLTWFPERKVSF
ncbi:MAG TPA: capsule assembly Wzi family protein [Terracidiphilus sp.]|jgi:hypothetical protein|nr:capsule assembly Wzi family protein [Terracidiphilus sp.]